MDDDANTNVEEVVEDNPQKAPVQEEQEQQEQSTEETQEQEETQEEETLPAPSRREQLRVEQLLKRYGQPPQQAPSQTGPDFRNKVNADEETYKELEDTARQYADSQLQTGIRAAEFNTWQRFLQMDEKQIRSKYPELDPSNQEKYHGTLEKTLQQKYLRFVGFDAGDPQRGTGPTVQSSDISYSDFVEAEMEFADELASQKIYQTTQNIAKQAATTGLRPDGSSPKKLDLNKSPEDMTDEELNAAIKSTMPRDTRGRFTRR